MDIFNTLDDKGLAMNSIVYTRLYTTADFDATGRFPVSSAGTKYAYQILSCFNGNIHVEPMTSLTSASYSPAMVMRRPLFVSTLKHRPTLKSF